MLSSRFAAAATAAALLFGCASAPLPLAPHRAALARGARVETVAKQNGPYQLLAHGRVRIQARGEFDLDHEDAQNLYIVIEAPPATIAPTFPPPAPPVLSSGSVRDARGALKLTDIGQGLPHSGEWRDHFAVGDLVGDGSTQIVFGPPRKSGGGPVAFRALAGSWERVHLQVPPGRYDYGGAAIGDFDGDGRNDLALAMHLTGFTVLRATGAGKFERSDVGLPNRSDAASAGSGVVALAIPGAPRRPTSLLLLQEVIAGPGPAQKAKPAPALASYSYAKGGFIAKAIGAHAVPGSNLVFAPSSPSCKAKLVIAGGVSAAPRLLERNGAETWTPRAIESFADPAGVVGAVAVGDLDGDGCSDLGVAYASRDREKWHSVVDIYFDRGSHWERINLLDVARGAPVTAMTIAPHSGRALLLTLDDAGTLRGYRIAGATAEQVIEAPAPDWRRGCAGSDIHVLPAGISGQLSIVASFAGEPTMGQFDRCRNGGGIEAWRID